MKKPKRSQKKRRKTSGGVPKGQQRQQRPLLSDEEYPQQPAFDPNVTAARRTQPRRTGSGTQVGPGQPQRPRGRSVSPRRNVDPNGVSQEFIPGSRRAQQPAGQQRPGQNLQQPGYSETSLNDDLSGPATSSFQAMSRTGARKRRLDRPQASPVNNADLLQTQGPARANSPASLNPSTQMPAAADNGVNHTQAFQRVNPLDRTTSPGLPDQTAQPQELPDQPAILPGAAPSPRPASNRGQAQQGAPTSNLASGSTSPNQAGASPSTAPSINPAGSSQQPSLVSNPAQAAALHQTRQEANRLTAEAAAPSVASSIQPLASDSGEVDAGPPTEAFDVASLSASDSGQVDAGSLSDATNLVPEVAEPMVTTAAPVGARRAVLEGGVNPNIDAPEVGTPIGGQVGKAAAAKGKTKKPLPAASSRKAPKKPSEPTKALMAIALSAIVLVGVGVAVFMFFRSGGEETGASSETEQVASAESEETSEDGEVETTDSAPAEAPVPAADGELLINVAADAAATGPLQAGTEYEMIIEGAAPDASLRYLIGGEPVGEAFSADAPTLSLEPGRQVISLEQTLDGEVTVSNAVAVYVLGETPARSYRANLKSVSIETEGWAEAVRQFDLLSETHPDLQLTPSDPYPSLTPGFWNLYIDGFDSSEAANAYCEQTGLAVPDECFAKLFDPAAPAE